MSKVKLHKSVQITLIIVLAVIILASIGIYSFKSGSMSNTISVNGQATEKVTPDLISVYFNVETKGTTSSEAESENSLIVNKLKSAIVALGFSEDDLKTENFNIYPDYDYNTRKTTGYRASHSLKIKFSTDDKDKIGSVIDAGATAGAGISYINFELSPSLEQQYKAEAIKTASEDARVKAESIAEGFDKRLGRLVSVSLDNFNYSPWRVYSSAGTSEDTQIAKESVTSITPSDREVTAYVNAVYRLR
jgi:uncharacterized protein YggE